MIEAIALHLLLGGMLIVGMLLALIAAGGFARSLTDLEYQVEAGISGGPRIQTRVKLRAHANRVGLGMTAAAIAFMTVLDLPWARWISLVLFIGSLVAFAVSAVLDWRAERRSVRLAMEASTAAATAKSLHALAERKSYQDIANEAVSRLESVAADARLASGEPAMPPMAHVVPEHSSPTTLEQQATADLQTMRARLVAAALELGQSPRVARPPEDAEGQA